MSMEVDDLRDSRNRDMRFDENPSPTHNLGSYIPSHKPEPLM